MKGLFLFWHLLLFSLFCYLSQAATYSPSYCQGIGHYPCVDQNAQCVMYQTGCAKQCSRSSDCSTNCCYNNYCMNSSNNECFNASEIVSSLSWIPIVFSIIGGVIILAIIGFCCWRQRESRKRIEAQTALALSQSQNNKTIQIMLPAYQQQGQPQHIQPIYYANQGAIVGQPIHPQPVMGGYPPLQIPHNPLPPQNTNHMPQVAYI